MKKFLVIIPTYNEKENIAEIIDLVLKQDKRIDILVVDDNSPDGTAMIVDKIVETNERVNIFKRKGKLGLGSAYVEGFHYAIKNEYFAAIEMDADFSHNPEVLPEMLETSEQFEMVIGSRYKDGVNVVNWSMLRLLLSYGASKYVNIITGMPIKDPTGGFNLIRIDLLKSIDIDKIISDGYSFQIEMKYRAYVKNHSIKEIPIVFTDRKNGESKMSREIIIEAVWMVWRLKYLQLTGRL
ncbi:MAG: polyprenol monophosphomannose synthase [Candidatus Cloacimonadota bacterium]|nr:polyprenol monophosphomannose synthase [Candidatus Cloacimonadota bacterium]